MGNEDQDRQGAVCLVEQLEAENSQAADAGNSAPEIVVDAAGLAEKLDQEGYGRPENDNSSGYIVNRRSSAFSDTFMPMPRMSSSVGSLTLVDLVDESFNLTKQMERSIRGSTALQRIDGELNRSGLYRKIKKKIDEMMGHREVHRSVYSLFEEESMVVSRLAAALKERNTLLDITLEETSCYLKEISAELEKRTGSYKGLGDSGVRDKLAQAEAALSGLKRGDPLYHRLNRQRIDLKSKQSREERERLLAEDMLEYKSKELVFVESLKESLDYQLGYSAMLYQRQEQITETVMRIGKIFEVATDVNQVSGRLLRELSLLTNYLRSYAHLVGKTAVYAGDVISGEKINGPITGRFADSIGPYMTDAMKLNQSCKDRSRTNAMLWMEGSDFAPGSSQKSYRS